MELCGLKRARQVFTDLQTALVEDVRRLEGLLYRPSLHHGINRLPDEILEKIFVMFMHVGHLEVHRPDAIRNLALVSRRFRDIIRNSRATYSNIDNRDGFVGIDVKLEMSEGLDLSITLSVNDDYDGNSNVSSLERVVRLLENDVAKCSFLHLFRQNRHLGRHSVKSERWRRWGTMVFPLTTTLVLSEITMIDKTWSFPNLQTLRLDSVACPEDIPAHLLSNLSRLDVRGGTLGFSGLHSALQSAPRLTALVLGDWGLWEPPSDDDLQEDTVILPYLTSLSMSYFDESGKGRGRDIRSVEYMAFLSRYLHVPALQSFDLSLKYLDISSFQIERAEDLVFFPAGLPKDTIKDVSFSLLAPMDNHELEVYGGVLGISRGQEAFVDNLFTQFPAIDEFTFRASRYTNHMENLGAMLRVRKLHIYGGYEATAFLPKLVRFLTRNDQPSNLREVWIHIRRDLDDEDDYHFDANQIRRDPTLETMVVSEQTVGGTVITLLETVVVK